MSPLDCLACLPAFDQVIASHPALQARWQALPRRSLPAGTALLRQGDRVASAWRIERGLVRCYFLAPDGLERNRSFHDEGGWIGAGAPPHPLDSPYTIEALESAELVELPYATLTALLDEFVMLRGLLDEGLSASFALQAQREANLLTLDAPGLYEAFLASHADLANRIALHHVARYVGITSVALSRIRNRKGMVAPRSGGAAR